MSIGLDISFEGECNFSKLVTILSNLESCHKTLVDDLGSLVGGLFSVLLGLFGSMSCPTLDSGDVMLTGVMVRGSELISGEESTVIQLLCIVGPLQV